MTMPMAGNLPAPPPPNPAGLVAGLGARAGAEAAEILALLDACLAEIGGDRASLRACVTAGDRVAHPALRAVAARLGVPLLAVDTGPTEARAPNPSALVARHRGTVSVAEAAALACGPLLLEKRRSANATCALARALYGPASAASAAATLATSRAGA